MEAWLEWARGPFFRLAFLILGLGLIRHLAMTGTGIFRAMLRTDDHNYLYRQVIITTIKWLFPFKEMNNRLWYSITSVSFHVGLILIPIFLVGHIMLWKRGIGIGWPGLPQHITDGLTVLTVVTGILLIIGRLANKDSRQLSRVQDFLLPPLLLVPFISGFLAMHPSINPVSYNTAMFIHVMSGNLIFILIPFTKIAHCVLLPLNQLVTEVGWHFPADSGDNVALALHKETKPV